MARSALALIAISACVAACCGIAAAADVGRPAPIDGKSTAGWQREAGGAFAGDGDCPSPAR
jgi:hypothetical protein